MNAFDIERLWRMDVESPAANQYQLLIFRALSLSLSLSLYVV